LENVAKKVNKKVHPPLLLIMALNKRKEEAESVKEMTNIFPKLKTASSNSEKFLSLLKKMVLPSKKDKD
jgi:ABC-type branched-subunit amino acid transport system ATPase component